MGEKQCGVMVPCTMEVAPCPKPALPHFPLHTTHHHHTTTYTPTPYLPHLTPPHPAPPPPPPPPNPCK